LYALLSVSVVLLPPGGITFLMGYVLLFVVVYWAFRSRVMPRYLAGAMLPFLVIVVTGLHGLVRYDTYDALKDAWYMLYPAMALLAGFALMRGAGRIEGIIVATLAASLITATIHLATFVANPELLTLPATTIRGLAGTGYYVTALGVALPLAGLAVQGLIPQPRRWLAAITFVASTASLTLAFSRTLTLVVAVLLIALVLPVGLRRLHALGAALIVFVVLAAAATLNAETASRFRGENLISKWTRTLEELEIREYTSWALIHKNWRGHESARAIATYAAGSPVEHLFGLGFGKLVDLRLDINLSRSQKSRYIPILHNGYVYLLIKTGILGVAAYVWVLVFLAFVGVRYARSEDPRVAALARLLLALVAAFAATTVSISGLLNKRDLVPLALFAGCLLGYFSMLGTARPSPATRTAGAPLEPAIRPPQSDPPVPAGHRPGLPPSSLAPRTRGDSRMEG
jgi:hypothetical protein